MGKILNLKNIPNEIKKLKRDGEKIVLTGGCFDILHVGHIEFLKKAKKLGDILIILLENDESITKMKGKNRPINNQEDRLSVLTNLNMVNYVIPLPPIMNNQNYNKLVKKIEPDIIAVTKGDPLFEVKKLQAKSVNGKIVNVMDRKTDYSTTKIAKKINKK